MNLIYWLYLWQIKEYRWDRLELYVRKLSIVDFVKEWIWGRWRRPVFTLKIGFIAGLTILLTGGWAYLLYIKPLVWWIVAILAYVSIPLFVALSVFIMNIPTKIVMNLLLFLAKRKRTQYKDVIVIGVTGSYGKTSTKHAIADLLSVKKNVIRTPGGVNSEIGVAKHVLQALDEMVDVYVVEMGAYHRGAIKTLVDVVQPQIGVLTGINEQHAALFGGKQVIIETKFELIEGLPKDGLAVINIGDEDVARLRKKIRVETKSYESTNIHDNVNAAKVIAEYLGYSDEEIHNGEKKLSPLEHRLEEKQGVNDSKIIDDSYNSNPDGFKSAVRELRGYDGKRKILVTTGVYELGELAAGKNRELHDYAQKYCDEIIITERHHREYFPSAEFIEEGEELVDFLKSNMNENVVILFEGRHRPISIALKELIV